MYRSRNVINTIAVIAALVAIAALQATGLGAGHSRQVEASGRAFDVARERPAGASNVPQAAPAPLVIDVAEAMGLSDSSQVVAPLVLDVAEGLGLTDSRLIGVPPVVVIDVAEPMSLSDSSQVVVPLVLVVAEALGLSDSSLIEVPPVVVIDVAEVMSLSDLSEALPSLIVDVSENIGLIDDPLIELSLCGTTISTNTTLTEDLAGCPGTALKIQGDNLTLDCAGHTISGTDSGNGVLVSANNVTVRNCIVRNFQFGINTTGTLNYFFNNTLQENSEGLITRGAGNTFEANTANNNTLRGFRVVNGAGNTFRSNTANGNGQDGFFITDTATQVLDNTANGNGRHGIALVGATNTLADGNTANNNQDIGIYLQTATTNVVSNNTAMGNFFGGIRMQSISTSNLISNNQVFDNGLNPCCRPGIQPAAAGDVNNTILNNDVGNNGIGIQVPGSTQVIGNIVHGNSKDGILVDGEFNTVDGNEIFNNTTLTVGSRAGVNLRSSNNNTIINNIIRNNLHFGIELRNSNTFNLFRGNIVEDNAAAGIAFAGLLNTDNTFVDNVFSNPINVGVPDNVPNTWNEAKTAGTNIIGGPFRGGNFFSKPDGTGFSQTCIDGDRDGICDSPFVLSAGNVDNLPLRDNIAPVVTPPMDTTAEAEGPGGTPVALLAAFLASASALDGVDGVLNVANNAPAVFPFGVGPTVVTFSATDLTGNVGTATATVTVVDTTPPVVTAPAKLAVAVEVAGKDGTGTTPDTSAKIAAFLAGATAFDTVDLALPVVNDAPKIFPEGTTQVSFRATDLSGNQTTVVSSVLVIEDGDGIHPFVDGLFEDGKFIDESIRFSDNFTDQHIAKGSTFGFIKDRLGLFVTVENLAPEGVLIGAEGADDTSAAVMVCDTLIKLGAGKLLVVTCGSLILDVIVGPVEVLNSAEDTTVALSTGTTATVTEDTASGELTLELDETTVVTVPSGTDATVTEFADGEFLITNDSESGAEPITIKVDGSEITVAPGDTYIPLAIDIKPGSDPNSINLGSDGLIPVAILTTSVADGDSVDFDVSDVDQATLTLNGAAARSKGKSGNIGAFEDVDGDGDLDLVVQFPTDELTLVESDTKMVLDGETLDGSAIHGSGPIVVVPP